MQLRCAVSSSLDALLGTLHPGAPELHEIKTILQEASSSSSRTLASAAGSVGNSSVRGLPYGTCSSVDVDVSIYDIR
jgi:hypothetical protein